MSPWWWIVHVVGWVCIVASVVLLLALMPPLCAFTIIYFHAAPLDLDPLVVVSLSLVLLGVGLALRFWTIARRLAYLESHCPACGYSLRGTPLATRCPECGEEL